MLQEKSFLIFFFSGLIFFVLGLLAILESKRNNQLKFFKVLPYLGAFAFFHAFNNWLDFFSLIPAEVLGLDSTTLFLYLRSFFTFIAFVSIFLFGVNLSKQSFDLPQIWSILALHFSLFTLILLLAYFLQIGTFTNLLSNLSKYLFAVPGSILVAVGAWKKAELCEDTLPVTVSKSFKLMSLGFAIYSILFIFPVSFKTVQMYPTPVLALKAIIAISIIVSICTIFTSSEQSYMQALQAKVNSLEILSHVDEVSGLHNHRYFQDCLKKLVAKGTAENLEFSFSLLLIDIDFFKEFNDKYGHPEGDKLLNEIGRVIKNLIRNTDVVARYGGDELAVILQQTHLSEAYEVAEKIRRDVAGHCFLNSPSKKVTLSIGVANCPHCAQNKDELIQVADTALYRAKTSRNKTECYSLF